MSPRPVCRTRFFSLKYAFEGATSASVDSLRELATKVLRLRGFKQDEIQLMLEVVMYAQSRSNNQGLLGLMSEHCCQSEDASEPVVEHETLLSAVINGHQSHGIVVMKTAVDLAVEKARANGIGFVGTNNTSSGTGALGYYTNHMASLGFIGFALSTCPEYVAPHGASQAVLGTNPISIAIPQQPQPLVLDMATSAVAHAALKEAEAAGQLVAEDVGFDAAGQPTREPGRILDGGALQVFDRSYKGSHLALMVEILAGPLVSAAVSDKLQERNWGNLVLALDPGMLGDPERFAEKTATLLQRVQGARAAEGGAGVRLPGEHGRLRSEQCRQAGTVPVQPALLQQLQKLAAEYDRLHPTSPPSTNDIAAFAAPPPAPTAGADEPNGASGADREVGENGSDSGNGAHGAAAAAGGARLLKFSTRLVHPHGSLEDPYGATVAPLYQTATFKQPGATTFGPYDYTRSGNPTRTQLEEQMAELEGADRSFAFASGMAALACVCSLVGSGGHIVAGDDLYGGTSRLLSRVVSGRGVEVSNVDTTHLGAVAAALIPGRTQLVLLESPTNPRMQICDIKAIADIAHQAGALVCVDNSILAPTFQQPIALGADISMTSATKFIAGHSDVTGGILSVKGHELAERVYFLQNAEGTSLGPFDCWLALRGLKTMALRMERQASNAAALAHFLSRHPLVQRVNYPGLPSAPGYLLNRRQASSGGSILSFQTGHVEASKIIVEETRLFKITVSFGNVTSLISLPCYMSHASIPAEVRAARGLPDDLVRISAGIEDIQDLITDLDQAMGKAAIVCGVQGH